MKTITKIIASTFAAAAILGAAPSCTDLTEHVYSSLSPANLSGTEDETADMLGNLYVQLRFMYWAWEGYFDINEESSDLIMTPYRTYGGWGTTLMPVFRTSGRSGTTAITVS